MSSKRSSTRNTRTSFNINHEDIREFVEPAFKVGETQYYRFVDDYKVPVGRYKYLYAFLREHDLRMDLDTLKAYVKELKRCLTVNKLSIDLEGAYKVVFSIESRTELAFEPDTIKRLASVVYFDDTEDLSTYDMKYGQEKIKKWDKARCLDFFLTKPISDLLGLNGISITSLEEYTNQATQIIKDLAYVPPNPSSEKASENGKST